MRHPLPGPPGLLESIRATRTVEELVRFCYAHHEHITASLTLGNAAKDHRERLSR